MTSPLRIGTRGSPLALWQANHVADRLRPLAAPRPVELVLIETVGDLVRDRALSQIGGDGLFTKEIQLALLAGTADVAVHSLKDLPTTHVEGLTLAAVPARGPTGDVFVSRRHPSFAALPIGAVLATSSVRRRAQVLHRRPDLKMVNIRGNVGTRLQKLTDEGLDATLLAEAGLVQGALGLECRVEDVATWTLLQQLRDPATHRAVLAERSLLRGLGGGCQVPIGAAAVVVGDTLQMRGVVLPPDGTRRVMDEVTGPADDAEELGKRLAGLLLARGARELLEEGGIVVPESGRSSEAVP